MRAGSAKRGQKALDPDACTEFPNEPHPLAPSLGTFRKLFSIASARLIARGLMSPEVVNGIVAG